MLKITVEGKTLAELAKSVVALGVELNSLGANEAEEKSHISVADMKKKGKKAKQVEEEDADLEEEESEEEDDAETEEESDDSEDEMDDDSEEDEEDAEEEAEALSAKDLQKLKLALKAYSDKKGKAKAVAALHKYAKTSAEVKPGDLPKLLKLLKA